jgi:hypothetical protein
MLKKLMENLQRSGTQSLAKTFCRLGWIGFWTQIVMGSIPFLLVVYTLIFARSPSGPRAGLALVEYLTIAGFLILIFTTVWFYRHTRLAKKIADPQECPPASSVIRSVWTGVVASHASDDSGDGEPVVLFPDCPSSGCSGISDSSRWTHELGVRR